ncbi:kinase to dihydroxyacetone kinase [Leuconostoc sp. S51]|uniref:kinase to dihydroxyacetone kinase n=1 Tax=unclassified Leuconostoc TaxID=2685106 RepID=UPI001D1CB847|nr:kinase to dihydroxyacetone kinase [Leuconostoc sp. S51]MBK0051469.1 kinase to dihydroxyacetone kinase [Leuconostoc sp. S50]
MQYKFDTQLLISGCQLSEITLANKIKVEFEGDSLIVGGDNELMKVHYHTNAPWKILEYCASVGEIFDVVVENMIRQSNGQRG